MFKRKSRVRVPGAGLVLALLLTAALAACGPAATPVPTTSAPPAPAATTQPPTATALPATEVPPTATSVPPTATEVPPTATAVPPTETAQPATAVPQATEQATVQAPAAAASATPAGGATPATTGPGNAAVPPVPHPVAGREQCLTCHAVKTGVKPAPADHEGRTNDLCLGCHVTSDGQGAVPTAPAKADAEFCLKCHGPFAALAARTANYTTDDGTKANPHVYVPHGDATKILACSNCHDPHPLPVKDPALIARPTLQYCFSACHHQNTFQRCSECHTDKG